MSPTGTLVAYSTPANIKQIRDQAALASMALADARSETDTHSALSTRDSAGSIDTLTVTAEEYNLVVQQIRQDLYLVLVGKCAPQTIAPHGEENEGSGGETQLQGNYLEQQIFSTEDTQSFAKTLLKIHQAKTDSVVTHVRSQLESA